MNALSIQHDGIYFIAVAVVLVGLVGGSFAARYTPKKWWGLFIHFVTLLLSSALAVSGLFLTLNRQNGWYSTLEEVMGTEKYDGAKVQDFGVASVPTQSASPTISSTPTPVKKKRDFSKLLALPNPGMPRQQFWVPSSQGGNRWEVNVWLPPQYFQAEYAKQDFPVIMLGSGFPGTPTQWYDQTNIVQIINGLVAQKKIRPVILVEPTLFPHGQDTECTWGPGGEKEIELWLAKDIPNFLEKRLRVHERDEGWAWMGISTGAFCGVMQSMYYPESSRAVIGLGGYYRPRWANVLPPWPDTDKRVTRMELPDEIGKLKQTNIALWLMNTTTEPEFSADALKIAQSAKEPMRVTLVNSPQGGHNWQTWLHYAPQGLTWLGKNVSHFAPLKPGN